MGITSVKWVGYATACLSVAVIAVVAALFFPLIGTTSAGFFVIAVIFTARFGGTRPAFLSLFLAIGVADYFFISPVGQFGVQADDVAWIIIFIMVSLWVMWLADSSRAAGRAIREREVSFRVTLASIGEAVITGTPRGA